MPAVPVLPVFTSDVLTTAELTQLTAAVNFLRSRPIADLNQTVAQPLTTSVWASITFTTETVDTDIDGVGGHDNAVNTSRFTARYPGWYQVSGGVGLVVNATGIRGTRWVVNGNALNGSQTAEAPTTVTAAQWATRTKHVYLLEGDYVELQAFQSSGGNLNTDATTTNQSHMSIRWASVVS